MRIQETLKRIFSGAENKNNFETEPKSVVRKKLLCRVRRGRLVIPEGMAEIPNGLFDGFPHERDIDCLVTVAVPASVRSIGGCAFKCCKNLQKIILAEGVESIGTNAFTDCEKLREVRLPASMKNIDGWAFYGSGLTKPVFSADGKTLVYYPQTWERAEYRVPEGVEEIGSNAFIEAKQLTNVILPQSLKRICSRAFVECGFTEITIPKDAVVETAAFVRFRHGLEILHENPLNALDEKLEYFRCFGVSFLYRQRMKAPQEKYWKQPDFRLLAQRCAAGSVEAMEKMGDYFFSRAEKDAGSLFCACAGQFWRVRAYRYGSGAAKQYLLAWCEENPDARMTSPVLDERLEGVADGEVLNALGFLFFKPGREYSLSGVDAQGVVEVSAWEGEDGPDEDGFGREESYDWWYLDEYLTLPNGVGYIHGYSNNDKRSNAEKFQTLHDQVAASSKK